MGINFFFKESRIIRKIFHFSRRENKHGIKPVTYFYEPKPYHIMKKIRVKNL